MKLAFVLDSMGVKAEELNTTSQVTTDKAPGDWTITKIHLTTTGKVAGIDQASRHTWCSESVRAREDLRVSLLQFDDDRNQIIA